MRLWPALAMSTLVLVGCGDEETLVEAPRIVSVEPSVLDYGDVFVGTSYTHFAAVRNESPGPLDLRAVGGPLAYSIDPLRFRLEPGQTEEVRIRFTPLEEGAFDGTIRFVEEAGRFGALEVEGSGIPREIDYPAEIDFGEVETGAEASRQILFSNLTDRRIDVSLEGSSREFALAPRFISLEPKGSAIATATFHPTAPIPHWFQVGVRTCRDCDRQALVLVGNGLAPRSDEISFEPKTCNFGRVPVGTTHTCTIALKNTGKSSIELESPKVSAPFTAEVTRAVVPPGEYSSLVFRFQADAPGDFTTETTLRSTIGAWLGVVSILGGAGSPLVISPGVVDFGTQPVGYKGRRINYLSTSNPRPALIHRVHLQGDDEGVFRLVRPTAGDVVEEGAPVPIEIELRSEQVGNFEAELIIEASGDFGVPARASVVGRVFDTRCDPPPGRFDVPRRYSSSEFDGFVFGSLGADPYYERTARIVNYGSTDCLVWGFAYDESQARYTGRGRAFEIEVDRDVALLGPGEWIDVTLRYRPSEDPCPAEICVEFWDDSPDRNRIVPFLTYRHSSFLHASQGIPIFARKPTRSLHIDPIGTIDFGTVRVGEVVSRIVSVKSAVEVPDSFLWKVYDVDIDDPGVGRWINISADEHSGPIGPDGIEFRVDFMPSAPGHHIGGALGMVSWFGDYVFWDVIGFGASRRE